MDNILIFFIKFHTFLLLKNLGLWKINHENSNQENAYNIIWFGYNITF